MDYKLLFADNKSRLFFESAIYNTILPRYKIYSRQPFDWESLKIYSTTFNAGFGSPADDLLPWLCKAENCDVIAIGMQECDTTEWLQAINETNFIKNKFTVVTIVTMWKVSMSLSI